MRSINRNARRLALLVPFLLIFVVVAIPLNHTALEQVGVTYSYSPAGPADLHVTLSHGPYRFDPKDVLFMTLRAIGRQFLAGDWDWNSRLLERNEHWAGPPGIQLLIQSAGSQFLERRFAVWALIRIIDYMVQNGRYVVTAGDLRWRGVVVGRIAMIPTISPKKLDAVSLPDDNMAGLLAKNVTERAKNKLRADDISVEDIGWFGSHHPMGEVLMGTLAAMVKIAERPGGNVQAFVGEWTGSPYSVFPIWWTTQRPSQLSKKNIFLVLVQVAHVQLDKNEYRCYKAILKNNGRYVGEGGNTVYPPKPPNPEAGLEMENY